MGMFVGMVCRVALQASASAVEAGEANIDPCRTIYILEATGAFCLVHLVKGTWRPVGQCRVNAGHGEDFAQARPIRTMSNPRRSM